jgi:hypothetical protein
VSCQAVTRAGLELAYEPISQATPFSEAGSPASPRQTIQQRGPLSRGGPRRHLGVEGPAGQQAPAHLRVLQRRQVFGGLLAPKLGQVDQ